MRALGLLTPMSAITLDEWEIPRDRVVTNRYGKLTIGSKFKTYFVNVMIYFGLSRSSSNDY